MPYWILSRGLLPILLGSACDTYVYKSRMLTISVQWERNERVRGHNSRTFPKFNLTFKFGTILMWREGKSNRRHSASCTEHMAIFYSFIECEIDCFIYSISTCWLRRICVGMAGEKDGENFIYESTARSSTTTFYRIMDDDDNHNKK